MAKALHQEIESRKGVSITKQNPISGVASEKINVEPSEYEGILEIESAASLATRRIREKSTIQAREAKREIARTRVKELELAFEDVIKLNALAQSV
ncbi:hypothetical protein V6N11_068436 [Hibiscus sabdariffa]|uniref:Uncharacterized protein n=2 Tax=Hibiscus sabdariffa TaxID=183260 RepID=A0ABR2CAR9_9ROSI